MALKAGRIEEYKFRIVDLTSASTGLKDSYSDKSINGLLQGVQLLENTFSANGSIFLMISGGNSEVLWSRNGTADASGTFYPRATCRFTDNGLMSGPNWTGTSEIALNSDLHLVLSGVGDTTSGLGLKVIYQ